MPLSSTTLHAALCAQPDTLDLATNAQAWCASLNTYVAGSVPGLANPALAGPLLQSTVGAALSTLAPLAFATTLQTALISFWAQLIPAAVPGQTAVLAPPTLAGMLTSAMSAALGCPDRASAMLPIADAINTWTLTILYGTPGTGPVTPLV